MINRFFSKIDIGNSPAGCWMWVGALLKGGYGQMSVENRCKQAHRLSYELFVGPIPDGLQIDHLCREPSCVNPLHLEAVSGSTNLRRGTRRSPNGEKTSCPRGHPYNPANTYVPKSGKRAGAKRVCRTCSRRQMRDYLIRRAKVSKP